MDKVVRKKCSCCEDYKPLTDFFNEKKKALGVQSRCKFCHAEGVKQWKEKKKMEEMENAKKEHEKNEFAERTNASPA